MDTITMSQQAAAALSSIGIGDFSVVETPERMAWVCAVLKFLQDKPEWFPKGKWATIQSIGWQVEQCAVSTADGLQRPPEAV
jgi:hypothetical protein